MGRRRVYRRLSPRAPALTRASIDIFYDAECALCRRVLRLIQIMDVTAALRFHASSDVGVVTRVAPGLSQAELDEAMYAVDANRRRYRGFFAFRRIVIAAPLLWPALLLLYFPGARVVGPRVYSWVATNRRRLGCRFDGGRAPKAPDAGAHRA
jgi:predicted DCC family thiol-disulfide oxidoreductase YuxK